MSVVLRLNRQGAKKKPFYRVVAADNHAPRGGKYLDLLGTFDPLKKENSLKLDAEKTKAWLKKGAIPSRTVASLIRKSGVEAK